MNASSLGADVPPPEQLVKNNMTTTNANFFIALFSR